MLERVAQAMDPEVRTNKSAGGRGFWTFRIHSLDHPLQHPSEEKYIYF